MQEVSAQIALRFSSHGSIHRDGREGMSSLSAASLCRKSNLRQVNIAMLRKLKQRKKTHGHISWHRRLAPPFDARGMNRFGC
jgi:hypothetical protein